MSDQEEEEYFNKQHEDRLPIRKIDNQNEHQKQNKQVFLNLGLFALLVAISSLIFTGYLAKKSRDEETSQNYILPFHNPNNRSELICPQNTSFDTTIFACVQCPLNCQSCYHEYHTRCLQCSDPFKLEQNECIEKCVSFDGFCVNTQTKQALNINYSVINLGTELRIQQLLQAEIHSYSQEHLYIIFPPLGESFNYFYSYVKLPELAMQLNSTMIVFSTPYTDVLQFYENDNPEELQQIQFPYIERIGNFLKNNYLVKETKQISIIAFGEMLQFAHEMSIKFIRDEICTDSEINVILMQTQFIQLKETIQLKHNQLQHLLAYINEGWDISHQENKTNFIADTSDNLIEYLKTYQQHLNFNRLIQPSYNKKINVLIISQLQTNDVSQLYQNGFNPKSYREIHLNTNKISDLFSELIRLV